MKNTKQERILEIFFRGLRGEDISVQALADEYAVSVKSITRSINDLKAFLANHRELVGNTELQYSRTDKCYRLFMDDFLSSKELFTIVEVLIGARAFSKTELLQITGKLKQFTTPEDRIRLETLIRKELHQYPEVKHDCANITDTMWQLMLCILEKREITIEYYRADRAFREHKLRPASLMFLDSYFYLIAFGASENNDKPLYFRVDRIRHITQHREKFTSKDSPDFDEGLLRRRSVHVWSGELHTLRFEYTGISVQAVMDKIPTARVIERTNNKYLIEAEVYGDGIKMWLLSQGSWVKVISPAKFVKDIKNRLSKALAQYDE